METKNSSPKPERAELPRISDRLTFIYAERCSISRDDGAISLTDEDCIPRVCGGDPMLGYIIDQDPGGSPRMRG